MLVIPLTHLVSHHKRQMFALAIQALVEGKVVARET